MLYPKSFDQLRRFAVDLPEMHPEPFPAQGDQDPVRLHLDEIREANNILNKDALSALERGDLETAKQSMENVHQILSIVMEDAPEFSAMVKELGETLMAFDMLGSDTIREAEVTIEAIVEELEQLMQEYEDSAADESEEEEVEEVEVEAEPQPEGPDEILMDSSNMHDISDAYAKLPPPRRGSVEAQLDAAYHRCAAPEGTPHSYENWHPHAPREERWEMADAFDAANEWDGDITRETEKKYVSPEDQKRLEEDTAWVEKDLENTAPPSQEEVEMLNRLGKKIS
jgi:hypothetical protein